MYPLEYGKSGKSAWINLIIYSTGKQWNNSRVSLISHVNFKLSTQTASAWFLFLPNLFQSKILASQE